MDGDGSDTPKRPTSSTAVPHARNLAEKLVAEGAIFTVPRLPAVRQLVGDLQWQEESSLLWFVAFGDQPSDARRLRFDQLHVLDGAAIYFFREGRAVGFLAGIEAAGVDDPDDYHMACQFWQQVAPLRRGFINRCYAQLPPPGAESTPEASALGTARQLDQVRESIRIYETTIAIFERMRDAMQQRRRAAIDSVMDEVEESLAVNERALASVQRLLDAARTELSGKM